MNISTFATAANPTQYTDTERYPNTTYYYKVVAVTKRAAVCSGVSCSTSGGKTVITWKAVDFAARYNVYRYNSASGSYTLLATTKTNKLTTDGAVSSGNIKVTAEIAAVSILSASANATALPEPNTVPAAPKNVKAAATGADQITITWDAVANATQ